MQLFYRLLCTIIKKKEHKKANNGVLFSLPNIILQEMKYAAKCKNLGYK